MKLVLHPSSVFILLITCIISTNIRTCLCDDDSHYTNCNKAFNCGSSITDLKYPFWGGNREKYCGDPELEALACEENVPKINISAINYRILGWDNTTNQLTVARDDYWDNICVSDPKNNTFDNTPFQYDNGLLENVTLFYDCPSMPNMNPYSQNCGSGKFVYYVLGPSYQVGSCTIVVIPIFNSNTSLVTTNRVSDALDNGFGLKWTGNYEACKTCTDSGGECGFDGEFKCFCKDEPHTISCSDTEKKSSSKVGVAIGASLGVVALVAILGCVYFIVRRRRNNADKSRSKDHFMAPSSRDALTSTTNTSRTVSSYPSSKSEIVQRSSYFGVQVFTYDELEEATKNFHPSRELGEGGFGAVYKGELQDGRVVAVKRLYESNFKRVEQFMNEVEILARLRHKNLVTLFGCTSRRSRELLLVYEFIPNGTVADHLQGNRSKSSFLPWPVRLNIAVETAEALAYLHLSDVIHRDVKSNNILLDDKFQVKVADFGLSRLFPNHVTHVSTAPQGTPGYVDPEYYQCYQLTDKSDVYSFGVVLVELISSLQAVDINRHRNDVNLANMAINKIQNQELHELVDPYLGFEKDYAIRRMTTAVAELAFRCLQQQREMRPSMDEVVEILRGIKSDELGEREEAVVVDVRTDDVIPLKKVACPVSPDSVVDKWVSGSSVSNSS
ncbi:LEAF RUST 10 DISEASE-RESISTANCE LOCUS RECEPTOR-LIKE PROTEIN KINASE-like 1.4 [Abrus precatorius]|uniref:non-specific serine/threonine protein kinase n=1 Tax=Abrus precatorius TaxID=3816 RepID=A0A8B8L052_ABRPR|nr:LEAF RUST 10 DISEASE-RESISTANCE LOCUS RECEPTOR-LIKE PROTEIN KINASE-like 1.4 [Abrus precatorius]